MSEEEAQSPSASASAGASSSSSSTSTDDDKEGGDSGAARVPQTGLESVQDKTRQTRTRRSDISTMWGQWFRLTPTQNGMQVTCLHPLHQNSTSACTKSRSYRLPSEETARVMLKRWAQIGADVESKGAHAELWQVVREELLENSLPSEESLDIWAATVDLNEE